VRIAIELSTAAIDRGSSTKLVTSETRSTMWPLTTVVLGHVTLSAMVVVGDPVTLVAATLDFEIVI